MANHAFEKLGPKRVIYIYCHFYFHAFDFILRTKKGMVFTRKSTALTEGRGADGPGGPAPFTSFPPCLTVSKVNGRTFCEMNPTQLPKRRFLFGCVSKTASISSTFHSARWNNANNMLIMLLIGAMVSLEG